MEKPSEQAALPGAATSSPIETLADAVRKRRAILFVGAGASMAVGLPSWDMLIDHLLEQLGLDRNVIQGLNGGYPMLAEFYRLKKRDMASLRDWLDRNWEVSAERVAGSALHRLIVELQFPIIYTTNYDRNLEVAFDVHGERYAKIANARDVAEAADGVTRIVKYHGDFDDEASLVLTETDFLDRLSFDSPLDIKFRSDALGRTILFIGYSMSDPNIRLLLHRIWGTWKRSGYANDRPPSFIFMPERNPVQEAVLARWGIKLLTGDPAEPRDDALVKFMGELKARVYGATQSGNAPRHNAARSGIARRA
jgi:hypothetical protein